MMRSHLGVGVWTRFVQPAIVSHKQAPKRSPEPNENSCLLAQSSSLRTRAWHDACVSSGRGYVEAELEVSHLKLPEQ